MAAWRGENENDSGRAGLTIVSVVDRHLQPCRGGVGVGGGGRSREPVLFFR